MNTSVVMERAKENFDQVSVKATRAAHRVEDMTAQVPSHALLLAALGSIAAALTLHVAGKKQTANFVGHWAPTLIAFALYNKIVRAQRDMGD